MATKKVDILIDAKDQASPVFKNVASSMGSIEPAAKRAGAAADPALDSMYQRGRKAAEGIDSISTQLQRVQSGLIALGLGNQFADIIKGVGDTADEYNNLAARIKLATGEGEAFDRAFERVEEIALKTNSALQSTGNLFTRLTEAGKSAGLGAQDAISQALELTESINQAVQVSGAGAQASDAAITQLIQGLSSGALRGEEFNSVMEQAPRLAKALADGLGVTTGQLRAMANEGRLSSDVVIGALKSQADTLKSEFETLPPTVGRAVQNLGTAWTVYVGEADKATGASRTAAQAINVLAENLDTIAGYLIDAGQAAAAFAALRLAQTFLGIGAAAGVAATATAAATVSTVANTAAQVQNAAATRASDLAFKTLAADVATQAAALGGNTAATLRNAAATTTATASAGRFAAILGGLKTFSLLGIVTNFQDIGTWIGEAAAKLAGYKDRTDELAQAERARNAAAQEGKKIAAEQALQNKLALDAQFELSEAAQSALTKFDQLVKSGKSAADAVAEIGKDFDLASLPGIRNAAGVLDKLQADGKLSATQFKQAWADALKGQDLQEFETKAKAAFTGTKRGADQLLTVIDLSLRQAIVRSGLDFDVLAGGMGKAARSAVNDVDTIIKGLDALKAEGVDVGKALEASLSKAIKTADSQAALDALRKRVEEVRKSLGDKVADGLLRQIEDQATKAAGALGTLTGALKQLGITSDSELKRAATETRGLYDEVVKAGGSAREQSAAYEKMAQAAIASGDAGALAYAKAQAAARGFEISTDSGGKTIVRSLKEAASAAEEAGASVQGLGKSIDGASAAAERYVGWADRMAERNKRVGSEEAAADERKRLNVDKDGFTLDKSGSRLAMGGDLTTLTGIKNFLQQAGLDDDQAKRVAMEFSDGKGGIPYFSNPGQKKYGGEFSTISDALLKAAERTTFGLGNNGAAGVGRPVNMTVNVGNKRFKGQASSDRDAREMVRALEHAASRT